MCAMCAAATALRPITRFCSQLSTMLQYIPTLAVRRRGMSSSIDRNRLFRDTEAQFPERWRKDGWYLSTTAALIASGQPELIGSLYNYIISQPSYQTSVDRQRLVRRMREAMIKCIILNGIPVVMEAFVSLAKQEKPEDQDHSFTRKDWKADEANHQRGLFVLETLYGEDNDRIWASFGSRKDIPRLSIDISYDLFLADHNTLDIVESELVILPAIMCQGLTNSTKWHLRGCLQVGLTRDEVECIKQAIERIAETCGKKLKGLLRVSDIPTDEMRRTRKVKGALKVFGNMLVYKLSRTCTRSGDKASSRCSSSMCLKVWDGAKLLD
ncbi:hypothetical protein BKA58DRAFT_44462 [Alternaria rosae]|uniref:uncharacterized protein n=1 Tax=Alternaria rosae TaxID=1187941 RepID=UPI001E8E1C8B|nr:uncharacterized protein BKA58DRAFT_44462 [Alternaria rosae]KAH6861012.1 hypothetical protein BKA58DRAFT_44462 [Alternaria rosae]